MSFNYSIEKINSAEFKTLEKLNITYGSVQSKFGDCLMGLSEDRFCFVHFGDFDEGFGELQKTFPIARYSLNNALVAEKIKLFEPNATGEIKLLLKGTEFEMRVWEYLAFLPRGKTTSYEDVAINIGSPKALRAVANAIAKNKIAFFVPCHRVISKNGQLNKFKWGVELKKQLLHDEEKIAKRKFLETFFGNENICTKKRIQEIVIKVEKD